MREDIDWIIDGTRLQVFKDTNLIYENDIDDIVENLVEELEGE